MKENWRLEENQGSTVDIVAKPCNYSVACAHWLKKTYIVKEAKKKKRKTRRVALFKSVFNLVASKGTDLAEMEYNV